LLLDRGGAGGPAPRTPDRGEGVSQRPLVTPAVSAFPATHHDRLGCGSGGLCGQRVGERPVASRAGYPALLATGVRPFVPAFGACYLRPLFLRSYFRRTLVVRVLEILPAHAAQYEPPRLKRFRVPGNYLVSAVGTHDHVWGLYHPRLVRRLTHGDTLDVRINKHHY
jgi:hypothetical protein